MIKIFHLSDIHLDSPFSLCSAGEAEKRRMELRSSFSSAVLYAKEQGAQLCFIAGDLFDSEYITGDGIQFISGVIRSYPDCRFFLSPGNHDPATDDSPYSTMSFPKNLHIFRDRERIDIPELNTTVYGVGFRSDSDLAEALNEFFLAAYADGTMQEIAETYGVQAALIEQK